MVKAISDGHQSVGLSFDSLAVIGQNKTGIIDLSLNEDFFGHATGSEDNINDFFDIYLRLGLGAAFTNTWNGVSILGDWNSVAGRIFYRGEEERNRENQQGKINAFFLGFCTGGKMRGVLSSEGFGFYDFNGGAAAGYHFEGQSRVFNLVATTGPSMGATPTGELGIHYFFGGRAMVGFDQDKEKIFFRKIVLDGKVGTRKDFWTLSAQLYGSFFNNLDIFAGAYAASLGSGAEADIGALQIGVAYQWD